MCNEFKNIIFPNKKILPRCRLIISQQTTDLQLGNTCRSISSTIMLSLYICDKSSTSHQSSIMHAVTHSPPLWEVLKHDTNVTHLHIPFSDSSLYNLVLNNTVIIVYKLMYLSDITECALSPILCYLNVHLAMKLQMPVTLTEEKKKSVKMQTGC